MVCHPVHLLVVLAGFFLAVSVFPALGGPLDPPSGPPSATMKTLQQVEPRVPVQTLAGDGDSLHKITQAGSYYLTGVIVGQSGKHGIKIAASNVVLDLNGFGLQGEANTLDGITVPGESSNVVIRNGNVWNWSGDGVDAGSTVNSQLIDVNAWTNRGRGLFIGSGSAVINCGAWSNGNPQSSDGIAVGHT